MRKSFAVFLVSVSFILGRFAVAQEPVLVQVERASSAVTTEYEGQIEAVTETRLAAQVAGVVQRVHVKAGDRVKTGQLLLEIDALHARQQQAAMQAQADATAAQLYALTQELERQKKLYAQNYISQGALERIEAEQRATAAQLKAHQAQAQAASVQTDFFTIRAPYDGVVIDVPAMQGDMAMPGMLLLSLFDPLALRVGVSVPVHALPGENLSEQQIRVRLGAVELPVSQVKRLSMVDASSQSVRLRLGLAPMTADVLPGQSVKVQLQRTRQYGAERLFIPVAAVVRRAELTAVYVRSVQHGRANLRQVRLGMQEGERVEVLSGLSEGEWIYLDQHAVSQR